MSNFVNTAGYLNDSPHKNNPFNIIKSKVITMNNVDIPLILRPNKGKSIIAMPNSGEYSFPKADYVFEKPLFQKGGVNDGCPDGFVWSVADQQCLPIDQSQASNFSGNRNSFITNQINPTGNVDFKQQTDKALVENQNPKLKRIFGTPNIPAITASNLLGYGLATFANNMEQGRQKAFMMKQMNNPLFNGSYSNAQNDYGVDPYEQTGQLRPQFQKGGVRDYLYSKGVDGSFENRKKLFGKYFDNYSGTAEQNTILMNKLKSGEIKINSQQPTKRYENKIPASIQEYKRDNQQLTPVLNIAPKQVVKTQVVPVKAQTAPVKVVQQPKNVVTKNNQIQTPVSTGTSAATGISQIFNPNKINAKPSKSEGEKAAANIAASIVLNSKTNKVSKTGNAAVDYYIDQIVRSGGKKILITDRGTNKTYYGTPDNIKSFDVLTGKNNNPKAFYGNSLSPDQIDALGEKANEYKVTPLGKFKLNASEAYGASALRMGNSGYLYHTVYPGELKQRMAAINSPNATDNNMSYGCINCKKPDIQALTGMFSTGDEGYTIDSRLSIPEIEEAIKNNKIKKFGGFFQKGGVFNPAEYLYGDDDDKDESKKQESVVKQKRITEEDVDNSNENLKVLGLSEEDILNMTSPIGGRRIAPYQGDSTEYSGNNDFAMMYLKHQQGKAGANAIAKAAAQGLSEVPRSWSKENIQSNMRNNIGKDFRGPLTPASFIDYWAGKVNRHMKIAANKQTPYDNIFQQVGQEEGINPLYLKAIANIESGINPNNNTASKYKGLFAINSKTFKGNVFDPYQNAKAAAKNLRMYEQGGEYVVDFATMKELQSKGIKFKIL